MKRFFAVFFVTVVLIGVLLYVMPRDFSYYAAKLTPDGTACIYCRQTSLDGYDVGFCQIVQCDVDELERTLGSCSGVDGVSVSFEGAQTDVARIVALLKATKRTEYKLGDVTVFCGFSEVLHGGVILDGKQVNVQIAYSDGIVTVGSPLIFGSY